MHLDKAASEVYRQAFEKCKEENIGILYFFALLRSQDPKKLFSVALQLKSTFSRPRYVCWAVIALQFQRILSGKQDEKELRLAESMLRKEFPDGQFETDEELQLVLSMTSAIGNYGKALDILEASRDLLGDSGQSLALQIDLLTKMEDYDRLYTVTWESLHGTGIKDWAIYKAFLKAYEYNGKVGQTENLKDLLSNEELSDERSIALARIEAAIRGYCHEDNSADQWLLCYAKKSFGIPSCLPDAVFMFGRLGVEQRIAFMGVIANECTADPTNLFWYRLLRIVKARESIWTLTDAEAQLPLVQAIAKEASPEVKVEALAHLALLEMDLSVLANGHGSLFLAISYARAALQLSPDSFVVKVLLIMLLNREGAIFAAVETFKSLDIKQIQLDTLSYLVGDHMISLADYQHTEIFLHEAFFIYEDNRGTSWNMICEAFARQSYSSIPEFFDFSRRLENSIQAVACIVGTVRFELLAKGLPETIEYLIALKPDELAFDQEFMAKITDNRDKDILTYIDQARIASKHLLDTLPAFNKAHIFTFTALPLLLRSLACQDYGRVRKLFADTESSLAQLGTFDDEHSQTLLDFFKSIEGLFNLTDESAVALDPTKTLALLQDLAVKDCQETVSMYHRVSCLQWNVESLRWVLLTIACYMLGIASKARRQILKNFVPVLEESHNRIVSLEAKLAVFDRKVDRPSTTPESLSEEDLSLTGRVLESSWESSLMGIKYILSNCTKLMQDFSKMCSN